MQELRRRMKRSSASSVDKPEKRWYWREMNWERKSYG